MSEDNGRIAWSRIGPPRIFGVHASAAIPALIAVFRWFFEDGTTWLFILFFWVLLDLLLQYKRLTLLEGIKYLRLWFRGGKRPLASYRKIQRLKQYK